MPEVLGAKQLQTQVIRPSEAARMLGVSRTSLWRFRRQSGVPAPVMLGDRATGFFRHELENWLRSKQVQ